MIHAIAIRNGKKFQVAIAPLNEEIALSDDDIEFVQSALEDIDEERTERFHRDVG